VRDEGAGICPREISGSGSVDVSLSPDIVAFLPISSTWTRHSISCPSAPIHGNRPGHGIRPGTKSPPGVGNPP